MFDRSGAYYDAIYADKDYAGEAAHLLARLQGRTLLDVACGTGRHAEHLAGRFQVTGLDLDEGLLECARRRLPGCRFVAGDMRTFDLGQTFDAVTCLFSAIGYLPLEDLAPACRNLFRHTAPGGTLVVEPWLREEMLKPGMVGLEQAMGEAFKVSRMSRLRIEGRTSVAEMHYLIGTSEGIRYESEEHNLTLFTLEDYREALESAGYAVEFEEKGLTGRGLFWAVRP